MSGMGVGMGLGKGIGSERGAQNIARPTCESLQGVGNGGVVG